MIRSSHGGAPARPKRGAPTKLPRGEEAAVAERPRAQAPRSRREGEEGVRLKKTKAPVEARSLSASARVPAGVSTASDEAREIAILVAVAALEKKASGLEVIDVSGRVDYADFLVLMSGRSDRHVTALSAAIEEALRKRNKRALAVEGLPHASWVLMDFGDVVVHVFQDDARAAYDIDGLWMDARRVPVPLEEPRP
jgi:ribosome-associated protein